MKTARLLASTATAMLAVGLAPQASAATTIEGAVSSISYHDVDPGLVITASALAFPSFTLDHIGDTREFDILTIGTGEGTVNTDFLSLFGEDTEHFPISVEFMFTNPAGATGTPITGSTFGFVLPFTGCGVFAGGCGHVDWGDPSVFSFGNGGQFSVKLFDATFGTPGDTNVKARFKLLSESIPAVPEPSTWAMMLLGFGALGATMRARGKRTKALAGGC